VNRTRGKVAETVRVQRDGFAAYGLRTDHLELLVIPELGASIVSLRSMRTEREWMWMRPDRAGLYTNLFGDAFEQSPLAGAVECIPTIAACTVSGRVMPDHGEAWSLAWNLDEPAFSQGTISTSVRLPVSGLELSRRIRLDGPVARLEYGVFNPSTQTVPYLWAFHPLLAVDGGDRIEVPASITQVRVTDSQGYAIPAPQGLWNWPEALPGVRLDAIDPNRFSHSFAKLFADYSTCEHGCAALCRGAERLEFRFDTKEISCVGLWITQGGWHGFTHVAIEPTTHASDSLDDARRLLAPMESHSWRFDLALCSVTE